MPSGWVKHFNDGTYETGYDKQVKARKASWRHGRLDGLVAADIISNGIQVTLNAGEGEWWQSDTLVSTFRGKDEPGQNTYLTRRVEYQINQKDIGKWLYASVDAKTGAVTISFHDEKK